MGLLDRAVRAGIRHGLRKGLLGGSQVWMGLGAVALGIRAVQRLRARDPVVVTERLEPGQTLIVRHFAPADE